MTAGAALAAAVADAPAALRPGGPRDPPSQRAGFVTDDEEIRARMAVTGRAPALAVVVRIAEVYLHCGRALLRSKLWDPASQALAEQLPTAGEMVTEQLGTAQSEALGLSAAAVDEGLAAAYRSLY